MQNARLFTGHGNQLLHHGRRLAKASHDKTVIIVHKAFFNLSTFVKLIKRFEWLVASSSGSVMFPINRLMF